MTQEMTLAERETYQRLRRELESQALEKIFRSGPGSRDAIRHYTLDLIYRYGRRPVDSMLAHTVKSAPEDSRYTPQAREWASCIPDPVSAPSGAGGDDPFRTTALPALVGELVRLRMRDPLYQHPEKEEYHGFNSGSGR